MSVQVTHLSSQAFTPVRSTFEAAGLDLFSPTDGTIHPGQRQLIPLDISITLPNHTYGHILPRSGLALRHGIHVGAGVIDSDYRGNVGVLLFNLSNEPFVFRRGDRIAQLVIQPYVKLDVTCDTPMTDDHQLQSGQPLGGPLGPKERHQGGFGSTGR